MAKTSACPVCTKKDVEEFVDGNASRFNCPSCGEFVLTRQDQVNLQSPRLRSGWNAAHLSALLREQAIRHSAPIWLRDASEQYGTVQYPGVIVREMQELLAQWPRTVPERIDRTLCNLARLSPAGGHCISLDLTDTSLAFAENEAERKYNISALVDRRMLRSFDSAQDLHTSVALTPDGWARFEELTAGASAPANPVFVAMWFGQTPEEQSEMLDLFRKAIEPAVKEAGYLCVRVDLEEHNDWIMDKVLGDIRLAPFVVADFTGNRNGVYLEAGFARGLHIPVIHTCRTADFAKAHFDTKQLNHVLYQTPEEFRTKLYHRILGSIGRGPHPPYNA